ncbi:MAG: HAD family phosphatase [Leptolyngbyaceae cyanobacterium CSU_1_4]|nr:HAD family phosphatase [Leptolyngbyaceae cyanobacterium CSU_1_4]
MLLPLPLTFPKVRLIATDVDGTLTQNGKFSPALLLALDALAAAGIPVLLTTGRSAGWVNGLAEYLPVVGAIAENGALFYKGHHSDLLVPIPDIVAHRQALAKVFARLQAAFPQIHESSDNRFRITDWTFDVKGLSVEDLQELSDRAHDQGWGFTYSTVQCHIRLMQQDKAHGLEQVLQRYFPEWSKEDVVTIGDSPNDESLFNGDRFPVSVGVANIRHYVDQIQYKPKFVTEAAEAEGFCELAQLLLKSP